MRKILVLTVILLMTVSLVFAQGEKEESDVIRIGLSMSAHTQFLENVSDAAANHAETLEGVELIITNANDDIDTQINDVESLITRGVDAIILNPLDKAGLGRSVDNIKDAGIYLVEVNTYTTNDRYDVYVGSNEEEAGRIQGRWIEQNIGDSGNVAVLYGVMGHSGQIGRFAGLKEVLLDKHPGWNLIADMTGNWSRAEGLRITEDWLQTYGDQIDVIASQNDEMALGALQAVENSGLDIPVLGIDAAPDAIQSVIDGRLALTVFQNSYAQGVESVNVAVGLVQGETYPKDYVIPYEEVNTENAAEYLEMLSTWK